MNLDESGLRKKGVVLGLSSGYDFNILRPLIKSLKSTGFTGDIILFISSTSSQTIKHLKKEGVILISYEDKFPYFGVDNLALREHVPDCLANKYLSPNSLRYILYKAYLSEYREKYDWVLHTDTRDVIFQKDPFSYYSSPGLYCFMEDESLTIGTNRFNSYWIKFGFGENIYEKLKNEFISCSGVTIGSTDAFCEYLESMIHFIKELPNTGGLDQGIHNYLIYMQKIANLTLVRDDSGPVTTLTSYKSFNKILFNKQGELVNENGQPFNIVHQYDRHLSLLWRFNKHAFIKKSANLVKQRLLRLAGRKID